MSFDERDPGVGRSKLPLEAAADLQDNLMIARNDLERLQRLLMDASETLLGHFVGVSARVNQLVEQVGCCDSHHDGLHQTMHDLRHAVTALQFQDMASQLIEHTSRRLGNCADRRARDVMDDEEDGEDAVVTDAPARPNPVTQDEMDAGSIELF